MHLARKLFAAFAIVTAIVVTPVTAQVEIDQLQKSADTLAESLASALPFNSTAGLNWSDAYIGQLIGLPPHFGFGVVGGATFMDSSDMITVLRDLGYEDTAKIPSDLPIPAAPIIEGRIGGFVLPFDLGFKVGFIPNAIGDAISDTGLGVDYFLFGVDARYAVYKGSIVLPKISAGIGFNYLRGGLSATLDEGQSFSFEDPSSHVDHVIEVTDPEIGLEWSSSVIDFKIQASKSFVVITPYIGLGLSYGRSKAGYFINSDITYDGNPVSDADVQAILDDLEEYNDALAANGQATFEIPDISSTGIESSVNVDGWAPRAFGGVSLNLFWLKVDLTGLYNFSDGSYGGTLGLRLQF